MLLGMMLAMLDDVGGDAGMLFVGVDDVGDDVSDRGWCWG